MARIPLNLVINGVQQEIIYRTGEDLQPDPPLDPMEEEIMAGELLERIEEIL